MSTRASELASNYDAVVSLIQKAAANVTLVAVSKYKPQEDIQALYDHGVRDFGENYVQELIAKASALPKDIRWHFIGGLQSGKCKDLANNIPNLFAVHSIDSLKKLKKLQGARNAAGGDKIKVFLQINTSGEDQKSGYSLQDKLELVESIKYLETADKLELVGLMTIGSFAESIAGEDNQDFKALTTLKKELDAAHGLNLQLSMGMSNDYLEAIRQGSTVVRVGSLIFGARPPKA